ncbi:tetratricopeptide repeat protein 29 isoform X3 [Lampetra fluviatilis]
MLTLPPIVKGSEARSGAQGGKGSGTTPTKGNSQHRGPASLGARGAEAGGRTTHRAARRRGGGPVLDSPPTEVESERRLPRTERVALHVDPLRDVCTSLLRDGHVGAFTELFRAVRERRAARLAADPGSALALEPPLEQHPRELRDLAALLSRAEDAARAGDADAQCQTLLSMAERFRGSGVAPWLEGRALHLCLEAAREAGGGPREAEALARLGEARHGHGDLEGALPVLRDYHALVRAQGWRDASGREHEARSSTLLSRLLTELGRRALDRGEAHESLGPLQEALSLARHGQESRAQQEASYWLGLALLDTGDTDSALQRLLAAEELSVALKDAAARARATRSVAEALLRLGRVSEAQRSLERLLEATRQSGGQEEELLDASCRLADIHLAKGSAQAACLGPCSRCPRAPPRLEGLAPRILPGGRVGSRGGRGQGGGGERRRLRDPPGGRGPERSSGGGGGRDLGMSGVKGLVGPPSRGRVVLLVYVSPPRLAPSLRSVGVGTSLLKATSDFQITAAPPSPTHLRTYARTAQRDAPLHWHEWPGVALTRDAFCCCQDERTLPTPL